MRPQLSFSSRLRCSRTAPFSPCVIAVIPSSSAASTARHTTASLAISTGANVKAVQRMLEHASAAMTLDVYADLFDDDLDTVAEALSKLRAERLIRQESDKGLAANRGDQP